MEANPEIAVTLSAKLLAELRDESVRLGVPIEYLVAGLVLDTFEEAHVPAAAPLRAAG